jgi:aminopeptidase-like protein
MHLVFEALTGCSDAIHFKMTLNSGEMKIFCWLFLSPLVLTYVKSVRVRDGQEVIERYINNNSAAPYRNLRLLKIPDITPTDWISYENNVVHSAFSRYSVGESIGSTANFIESNLRVLGFDVEFDYFAAYEGGEPKQLKNIYGRLLGSIPETILIGAHYDDLPSSGPAPGADDNASGVATMLSVARSLSGFKPKRNIVFVAFSAEEQGTIGSTHFAEKIAPTMNIVSAIILDQNGNPGATRSIIMESVGKSDSNLRIIDTIADSLDKSLNGAVVNYKGFGSDHVPLANKGIPAVLVIERENMQFASKYGHTSRDDLSNIDGSFGSGIANTVLETVVRLAEA